MQYQMFFAIFLKSLRLKESQSADFNVHLEKRNYVYINTMIYILKDLLHA